VGSPAGESLSGLAGRVVVVTGGSRGLGRSMVLAYARHGASVVIASRNQASCDELASQVTSEYGTVAVGVPCHVGHWDECGRLIDAVYDGFGRIDVLVNNAGMSPLYPSLPEVTEELYDKVMAVNLKGPFRLGSLAGARMQESGGGCILNISSIAAVRPTAREVPYAAAKAGLNTLTKGLAVAYGPAVRVNAIMAGPRGGEHPAAAGRPARRDRRCGTVPDDACVELLHGGGAHRRWRHHLSPEEGT
jgi:NAD(P)-dependent dehydrogenase (short-subunit alcohol dehydrogenase family)